MPGNVEIIDADRCSLSFKIRPDLTVVHGCGTIVVKYLQAEIKSRTDAISLAGAALFSAP